MVLTFLKSKLHGAIVTHSELEYDGSCAIDSEILKEAEIPVSYTHLTLPTTSTV